MHVVYICTSVLMNYDCTTHPNLLFITIATKFLSKHYIKRIFDTEMNCYHSFNFTEKTFLQSADPKQPSNFHFDLSLKLSQGEVHDFSGEVQKFSGEVQYDLRGGAHLPSKSGHVLVCVNKGKGEVECQPGTFCRHCLNEFSLAFATVFGNCPCGYPAQGSK